MHPYQCLKKTELLDCWTLPDLSAYWTAYIQQLTNIPVTLALGIEQNDHEDGTAYLAVRIHEVYIPPEWEGRLGTWEETLTQYSGYAADLFQRCWTVLMRSAPMTPIPQHHEWTIQVQRSVTITPVLLKGTQQSATGSW